MLNQRGEVVTGVMVAMMVIMMLFGGMHWMHGDHQHGNDHDRTENKHDHQHDQHKEGMHHMDHDEGDHSGAQEGSK